MQTTLTIDDDVLAAAENLAHKEHQTVGKVLSDLARKALRGEEVVYTMDSGIPVLPLKDHTPITLEFVNELRDEHP